MGSRIVASVIPVTLAILGVLIANLPVSFLGGIVPPPLLGLMPVYFWCLVRPDLMTPFWALRHRSAGGSAVRRTAGRLGASLSSRPTRSIDRQRDAFAGLSGLGAILGFAIAAAIACATAYVRRRTLLLADAAACAGDGRAGDDGRSSICPAPCSLGCVHRRLVGPLRSDF